MTAAMSGKQRNTDNRKDEEEFIAIGDGETEESLRAALPYIKFTFSSQFCGETHRHH
jgi:hypothetical protein